MGNIAKKRKKKLVKFCEEKYPSKKSIIIG